MGIQKKYEGCNKYMKIWGCKKMRNVINARKYEGVSEKNEGYNKCKKMLFIYLFIIIKFLIFYKS